MQPLLHAARQPQGVNIVTIIDISAPSAPPNPWLPWAIGAGLLLAAGAVAHRRAGGDPREVPSRRTRILVAGLAWGACVTAMFVPRQYAEASGDSFLLNLAVRLAMLSLLATALLAAVDPTLDYFQPRRRRQWLVAGPAMLAALLPATLFVTGLAESVQLLRTAGPGPLAIASAAAGFVWWSWLPASDARLAQVFE